VLSERVVIADSIRAWAFQPSAAIMTIRDRAHMNADGTRLFYASSPTLDATKRFSTECNNTEKTSVVLGCYVSGRIYLYDIQNTELDGIEEVTASHEMLHAAYERLDSAERARVDSMLEAESRQLSANPEFKERMSVYSSLSSADRINELHSVIGTEISQISPELERYYATYFTNRHAVTSLYDSYHTVFAKLQQDAKDLAKSLDRQAAELNARVNLYNQQADQLDADVRVFNQRASSGYFSSRAAFDAARAVLVARSNDLDQQRVQINLAVDAYEKDRKRFDGLASHLSELNNSLDSNLAPAPSVGGAS
jgi:hypothetical protein